MLFEDFRRDPFTTNGLMRIMVFDCQWESGAQVHFLAAGKKDVVPESIFRYLICTPSVLQGRTYALIAVGWSRHREILFASLSECMDQRFFRAGRHQLMSSTPILAVTSDKTLLGLLRSTVRNKLGQKGRLVVAGSVEEACPLLKTARPQLIVVHLTGEKGRYEQLDRLLWATSVVSRPTPIVVIAERYRIDQATMMYRMGVSEYISRKHHLDQLSGVLGSYLSVAALKVANENGAGDWGAGSRAAAPAQARVV